MLLKIIYKYTNICLSIMMMMMVMIMMVIMMIDGDDDVTVFT